MKNIILFMLVLFFLSAINAYSAEPVNGCNWIYNRSMAALFVGDYNFPSGAAVVLTTQEDGEIYLDLATNQSKMMYAMLLSSKLAGKSVDLYICNNLIYRVTLVE